MKDNIETYKTIVINMTVTFVQAGLAVWAASGFRIDRVALGAVVGAGASAVWNVIIKPFLKKQKIIQ